MTPAARFDELERTAALFFQTGRWKTAFCNRYGLTPQAITAWANKGAPLWAVQAMADAWKAKQLSEAVRTIQAVQIDG